MKTIFRCCAGRDEILAREHGLVVTARGNLSLINALPDQRDLAVMATHPDEIVDPNALLAETTLHKVQRDTPGRQPRHQVLRSDLTVTPLPSRLETHLPPRALVSRPNCESAGSVSEYKGDIGEKLHL